MLICVHYIAIKKCAKGGRVMRGESRPWLLLSPALVVLSTLMLAPLALMAAYTLFRYVDVGVHEPAIDFRNWLSFFTDRYYQYAVWKTARVALLTTLICILLGYFPAYFIASVQSRWRWLLMLLLLIPFWISFVIRTMSWIHVLGINGAVNTFLQWLGLIDAPLRLLYSEGAVVMGLVHFLLPFTILNIFVSIESSDRTLVPVARTLGATPLGAFRDVTLPLSLPGVATGALVTFVLAAGSYVTPFILGGPDDYLFGNLIFNAVIIELNWPMGSTLAFALVLMLLGLILIYNRYFGLDRLTRGLT